MRDTLTDINLPFVIKDRGENKELIAKTIMRKPKFRTTNRVYPISEINTSMSHDIIDEDIQNDKLYSIILKIISEMRRKYYTKDAIFRAAKLLAKDEASKMNIDPNSERFKNIWWKAVTQ